MAEFIDVLRKARSEKQNLAGGPTNQPRLTEEITGGINPRQSWINNRFLPIVAEANNQLSDECVIKLLPANLSIIAYFNVYISCASQADGDGTKVGAIAVLYTGDVATYEGIGGPAKIAGSYRDPGTVTEVKSELLKWLSTWAKAQ